MTLCDWRRIAVYPQQNQNCYINGKAIATFIHPYGLCLTTSTTSKALSNASPFTPKSTVARLKVPKAQDLITVVGNFANIQAGQTLALEGTWQWVHLSFAMSKYA